MNRTLLVSSSTQTTTTTKSGTNDDFEMSLKNVALFGKESRREGGGGDALIDSWLSTAAVTVAVAVYLLLATAVLVVVSPHLR